MIVAHHLIVLAAGHAPCLADELIERRTCRMTDVHLRFERGPMAGGNGTLTPLGVAPPTSADRQNRLRRRTPSDGP
jgi:hypothetical protein